MILIENKPLAPFTTFGIGGPARWFVEAETEDDVVEAAAWAREREVALFVLGGGSNLLVSDAGFDGLVLRVGLRGIAVDVGLNGLSNAGEANQRIYHAAAGEEWAGFVERTVADNCAGVECLAGIPGTVGGTPVQNVGAYGQEVASAIARVRAFDLQNYAFVEFETAECSFAYRRSRFNSIDRGRYIVVRVDYRLTLGGAPVLGYPELERAILEGRPGDASPPSLAEVASVVQKVRKSKGMMMVERDVDCRSAGSFFKNPVLSVSDVRKIAQKSGKEPPSYPAGPDSEGLGRVKLSAAWLIGQAGFQKGYALGAAGVSSRHTLALVNRGGATAAEILALARQISTTVEAQFGIRLEIEPVRVGF